MPFFQTKPKTTPMMTWSYQPTRLVQHGQPPFSHFEARANSELNKVRDFVAYKGMQSRQSSEDLARLSQHTGRVVLPAVRTKIGPDKNSASTMNHFVGSYWPSLRHDFGVTAPDGDARSSEFRVNFEQEISSCFQNLDPLSGHFEKLGLNIDELQERMLDMRQTELEILDTNLNPHPKDKWGRKALIDFPGTQLIKRNELRYIYQDKFNSWADETGAYVHIRFESQNQYARDRSAFNQDLVFIFPTSDEEREIWRHVFLGGEYPEAGFPVETTYARQLRELMHNGRVPVTSSANALSDDFSRMALSRQGAMPPH